MPSRDEIASMAHLMRRAGFSASREELEARVATGYEATVEELLNPETEPPVDDDVLFRYFPNYEGGMAPVPAQKGAAQKGATQKGTAQKGGKGDCGCRTRHSFFASFHVNYGKGGSCQKGDCGASQKGACQKGGSAQKGGCAQKGGSKQK